MRISHWIEQKQPELTKAYQLPARALKRTNVALVQKSNPGTSQVGEKSSRRDITARTIPGLYLHCTCSTSRLIGEVTIFILEAYFNEVG